jgi:hypothetical protein
MKQHDPETRLVRNVIAEGMAAFAQAVPLQECPYEKPDGPLYETITKYAPNGKITDRFSVRTGIDWQKIWQIGWNIAEFLEKKHAAA